MSKRKVLMIASECTPFAKTGGLADIVGTLPEQLNNLGMDCRVMMPLYRQIKEKYIKQMEFMRWTTLKMGWRSVYSGVFRMEYKGITYYFIDNEFYFNSPEIYTEYSYDIERFSFFQRACLETLGEPIDFMPDIIHCHDWQAGMVPCLIDAHYRPYGYLTDVKTVFTIHNLKYQGIHGVEQVADLMDLPEKYFNDYGILKDGLPNFMKAGIVYSDQVTTVSPSYAKEIFMPYYGEGLDGVLRTFSYKVSGILNGIDHDDWNPQTDGCLAKNYGVENYREGKKANKAALQEAMDLERDTDIPMITMVTRLVDQKGLDLILRVIDELLMENCQVLILGTGDPDYENSLREVENRHHANMRSLVMYSNELARQLYAAGDIFLMPSLFEPCGLSQMIAMRYGNVPLVRETGGLRDTVHAYNPETKEGNGFSFPNINAHDMLFLLKDAMKLYQESPEDWDILVHHGMEEDFSWETSAKKYLELYEALYQ